MMTKTKIIGGVRILMVVALLAFVIVLQRGDKTSTADIDDVAAAVTAQLDLSNVQEGTHSDLKKYYGLSASDYEGVVYYAPVSNMDAEELLIIKLKDTSQADTVESAIQSRLETQKNTFDGYGVEQYNLLEKSVLDVKGNYILYVVHADASKADQAFKNSL